MAAETLFIETVGYFHHIHSTCRQTEPILNLEPCMIFIVKSQIFYVYEMENMTSTRAQTRTKNNNKKLI